MPFLQLCQVGLDLGLGFDCLGKWNSAMLGCLSFDTSSSYGRL